MSFAMINPQALCDFRTQGRDRRQAHPTGARRILAVARGRVRCGDARAIE
jgi:hypothetical protein